MDVNLFASLLKELILDNERVTLPGLGTVESFVCPSVFTDRGYTLQPPYRQLSFSDKEAGDTLLVDRYAAEEGVVQDAAEVAVRSFTASVKDSLRRGETVDIPGLGRFRSTMEGSVFFVCDEDIDIYPEGLGLVPVSLKNNRKEVIKPAPAPAPEPEVKAAPIPAPVETPAPEPAPTEAPAPNPEPAAEETPAPAETPESAPVKAAGPDREPRRGLKVLIWTAAAAAVLLAALAVAGRVAPGFVDPLLYSAEELEIINHR